MGRWVTSQGRRIYIPDEGEKVPEKYQKNVVEGMTGKMSNNSDKEVTADAIRIAKLQKKYGMSDEQMQEAVKLNDYNVDKLERSLGTADKIVSTVNKNEDTKEKQIATNKAERDALNESNKKTGKMENFGNAKVMQEQVNYQGVKMTRAEARRIDKIKEDLGYYSYKGSGNLSETEKQDREKLRDELRKFGKKYGISVGFYLPGGK